MHRRNSIFMALALAAALTACGGPTAISKSEPDYFSTESSSDRVTDSSSEGVTAYNSDTAAEAVTYYSPSASDSIIYAATSEDAPQGFDPSTVPVWDGSTAYVTVNNNVPFFTAEQEETYDSYEHYSQLDALGRCGTAIACIGTDLMPTEERGEIGSVKPSGWHSIRYDFVDGKYLYNRCHLIGYQLTGENANPQNLITGTRNLNIAGMLPFENATADYLHSNENNHVMYRVTPYFTGDDLVADGVLMEGYSTEDNGALSFCVWCYNEQPGVTIDHMTGNAIANDGTPQYGYGESAAEKAAEDQHSASAAQYDSYTAQKETTYVLNTNTMKIHLPSCEVVQKMSGNNRQETTENYQTLLGEGYSPCGICHPENAQ